MDSKQLYDNYIFASEQAGIQPEHMLSYKQFIEILPVQQQAAASSPKDIARTIYGFLNTMEEVYIFVQQYSREDIYIALDMAEAIYDGKNIDNKLYVTLLRILLQSTPKH